MPRWPAAQLHVGVGRGERSSEGRGRNRRAEWNPASKSLSDLPSQPLAPEHLGRSTGHQEPWLPSFPSLGPRAFGLRLSPWKEGPWGENTRQHRAGFRNQILWAMPSLALGFSSILLRSQRPPAPLGAGAQLAIRSDCFRRETRKLGFFSFGLIPGMSQPPLGVLCEI